MLRGHFTRSIACAEPGSRAASLAVVLGTLLAVLDLGIINISLPTIATGLGIPESKAVWISTVYQLVCAATLMVCSAISYILGKQAVYISGLFLFSVGSLGASLAPGFEVLIGFRVVQGLGAAALFSLGPSLLRAIYPPSLLGRALGLNALVVATGLAAGPSLGGVVLALADWPWIFALNIPVGLVAAWLAWTSFPREPMRRDQFDWQGALLSALMMGGLLLAMERFGHGAHPLLAASLLACSLTAGWLFIRRQRQAPKPLLPLVIFQKPRFSFAVITTLLAFTSQGLAFVALSFLYQSKMGYSPLEAALLFAPWPIALLFSGPVSGRLSDKVDPRLLSTLGLVVFLVGMSGLAWGSNNTDVTILILASLVCGLGYGFFQAPNNHEIMANAPVELSSTASGVLASVRTLGQSLGSAVFALVLSLAFGSIHVALWTAFLAALLALVTSVSRTVRVRGDLLDAV